MAFGSFVSLLAVISVSECWDIVAERVKTDYERGRRPLGRLRGLTGCWIMDSMESLNKTGVLYYPLQHDQLDASPHLGSSSTELAG